MAMRTGNGDFKVLFCIVIPLMMQQVTVQLQLLDCNTKAKSGILLGKDAFDQLCYQQDYTDRIVYIKWPKVPLVLENTI